MNLLRTMLLITLCLGIAAPAAAQILPMPDSADPAETESAQPEAEATDEPDPEAAVSPIADLGTVFEETPLWGWGALLLAIFLGLLAGKFAQIFIRAAAAKLETRGWHVRAVVFQDAAAPASLCLLTLGLQIGFLPHFIHLTPDLSSFVGKVLLLLYIVSLGWFIYNAVDVVDLGLRHLTASDKNRLSAQIVPLVRKALRVFIVVIFTLFIAQNVFEVNITAWLAGLGIAGLAVSLAAQDSIKNLFGSITVLLDKPFAVGDRITFGEADGFVEEVGLRSTKLRTFAGHLVTIPNMKFIDGTVENISARPFIRRSMNVTITYDTPADQIDRAVQIIRDILADEEMQAPFDLENRPPRVYFNDLNADSLNISVAYWYFLNENLGHDWWGYMEHAQAFNRRLFRAFADAGIDFAFPTQTLYLAGDPDRQLSLRLLQDNNGDDNGRVSSDAARR